MKGINNKYNCNGVPSSHGEAARSRAARRYAHLFILFLTTIYIYKCSMPADMAGGGVQTTNGDVVYSSGIPAENARIYLRPADYIKDRPTGLAKAYITEISTTTDSEGQYYLETVEPGDYIIEANDRKGMSAAYRFSIEKDDDITQLPTLVLEEAGVISGSTVLPDTDTEAWVQVLGLERAVYVDNAASFEIEVPRGIWDVRVVFNSPDVQPVEQPAVEVVSGETAQIIMEPLPVWKHTAEVVINTSADGADISGDLHDFPLLIRLDASNFLFSQARPDGSDLRFAGPDGAYLDYEIDTWDTAAGTGAVWVKVDTIKGNNRSQYIAMHWGNSAAPDRSNGPAVFSTDKEYRGVWHLDESTGTAKDATAHGNNGLLNGDLPTSAAGYIGQAQYFDGDGDYIDAGMDPSLDISEQLTASAWVRSAANANGRIVCRHGDDSVSHSYGWYVAKFGRNANFEFSLSPDGNTWNRNELSDSSFLTDTWYHVAAVYDGAYLRTYINGVEDTGKHLPEPYSGGIYLPDYPLTIGITGNLKYPFKGEIDEVRVSAADRSPDWVKMCYENQRKGSTVIKIK